MVELDGHCNGLVAGCAVCEEDFAPYLTRADCDEYLEWCCVPADPADNDCEDAGGVCVPDWPENECPVGWEVINTSCGDDPGSCCLMSGFCA